MLSTISWIVTVIALTGTFLNIQQNKYGFALWTISNICLCCINMYLEQYAQAFLFLCYTGTSIWGYVAWSKKEAESEAVAVQCDETR